MGESTRRKNPPRAGARALAIEHMAIPPRAYFPFDDLSGSFAWKCQRADRSEVMGYHVGSFCS